MSDSLNRRDLLKGVGAAGLSLGLAKTTFAAHANKMEPGRVLGANDRIQIGVIGVGGRGYYVAEAFTQYAEKNNNAHENPFFNYRNRDLRALPAPGREAR